MEYRPTLIGLDFDGVVVTGSNDGYVACYHRALADVGVTLDTGVEWQRVRAGWGTGHVRQFESLLAERPELVEAAARAWEDHVGSDAFWDKVRLVDGAREAVARMASAVPVAIISGARKEHIERLLKRDRVVGVSAVYSSYDVPTDLRKPHPHQLRLAIERFGARPDGTAYVGDMANDLRMARAAGALPVAVLTGGLTREAAEAEGAALVVEDIVAAAARLVG